VPRATHPNRTQPQHAAYLRVAGAARLLRPVERVGEDGLKPLRHLLTRLHAKSCDGKVVDGIVCTASDYTHDADVAVRQYLVDDEVAYYRFARFAGSPMSGLSLNHRFRRRTVHWPEYPARGWRHGSRLL
jgi:hypothetical protein